MKTAAKASLIVLGTVAAIALLSSLVVRLLFDPNQYRAEISKLVEEKTGHAFQIRGDVEFNFFPWLGLKANDLELANAAEFGPDPLAAIDRLKLRVRLLPLLGKELEFGNIAVSGLRLNLLQLEDGRSNWQGLRPGAGLVRARKNAGRAADAAAGAAFVATSVGGLNVKNAQVSWISRMSGTNILIENLVIRSGTVRSGEPFEAAWEFDFHNRTSGVDGHLQLTTTTALNLDRRTLNFQGTSVTGTVEQPERLLGPLKIEGRADVLVELAQNRLELKDLSLAIDEIQLSGQLAVENLGQAPHAVGELTSNSFDLTAVLNRFGRNLAPRADPKALQRVNLQCRVDATAELIRLDPCSAQVDDTQVKGTITVDRTAKGGVRFDFELDRIDLDRYGPAVDPAVGTTAPVPPTATPAAKPEAPGGAGSNPGSSRWLEDHLEWWLGRIVSWFQPPRAEAAPAPASTAGGATAKPGPAPGAALGPVTGTVKAGALKFRNLELSDLSTRIVIQNNAVELESFQTRLYGGTATGRMRLDQTGNPGWQTTFHLVGVDLGRLLRDLNPTGSFTAKARDVEGTLSARGSNKEAYKKSLNGKMRMQLTQVKGVGFDLNQAIINATPVLEGKLPKQGKRSQAIGLDRLNLELTIINGRIEVRQLAGESETMKLTGSGTIDLPDDRISILILATMQQEQEDNPASAFLIGVPIPIQISGPLRQPVVSLDLREVLKNTRETRRQERREDRQEKFQNLRPGELFKRGGPFRR